MMGIWDRLLRAEQKIRKRVENAFGQGNARTPLEIRRGILEQVESRMVVDRGGKVFPFEKVVVRLRPPTEALRSILETAFIQDDSLRSDILQKLRDSRASHPREIQIAVELATCGSGEPDSGVFELEFAAVDHERKRETPAIRMTVLKGSAEKTIYDLNKDRILVGRLSEVLDREGRMIRRNDVVFLDNGEDVNSSVGRSHSRIWFDSEKQGFRIMDEMSRYGTRIMREGRSIEVPGGNTRGVRLRSGDEIYFGQACIRFDISQ
jgi:hypothetical protein